MRFISDLHFGHELVSKIRGFKTTDEHDKFIIDKWNQSVNKRNVVYILGDIALSHRHICKLGELNGIKKVVLGNHDTKRNIKEIVKYASVYGSVEYKDYIITHFPVHDSSFPRYKGNIHGHIHSSKKIDDSRYISVCIEHVGYCPVLFDKLKR
jgi:calcineurin-like phosphoesterase family protein